MSKRKKIILRPTMASKDVHAVVIKALNTSFKTPISIRDFCAIAKMSRMTLWQWENQMHEPRLETLAKVCKGLNKVNIPTEIRFA